LVISEPNMLCESDSSALQTINRYNKIVSYSITGYKKYYSTNKIISIKDIINDSCEI